MEEEAIYPLSKNERWSKEWTSVAFRYKIIAAIVVFSGIVFWLPYFFAMIEARPGIVLNDWLLLYLPAKDFSITIFLWLWSTSLLIIYRCIQQPAIFLKFSWLLILLTLSRIATISLFPLDPPPGIIYLKDPITSLSYGGPGLFITRDLFFSGHTANLFLIYLCLQRKRDKQFALLATLTVGFLLLVQHVHYTIDVAVAIAYTWCLVKLSERTKFLTV